METAGSYHKLRPDNLHFHPESLPPAPSLVFPPPNVPQVSSHFYLLHQLHARARRPRAPRDRNGAPNEIVVIGVHSAKFTGEKHTDNIRQAVLRYGIEHPVVNDHSMQIWQEYAVRAWPSFMLIDPNGKITGTHSGEQVFELFDGIISQMVEHFAQEGTLNREPLTFALEAAGQPDSVLSFPGKILADDDGDRLFIADSGHNRIVVASLSTGHVLDIVGSGEPGLADGDFGEAQFRKPQGLAVEGDLLYIADTNNHAIRRADLRARTLVTLAGDGQQTDDFESGLAPARGRRLNSPWDLDLAHGVLFIAMAGSHQVWGLDLEELYIAGHAGSGREDHVDGPLLAASLAQPSGLTHDDRCLFVADSEVSSIRAVDLDPRGGHIRTVVGHGLFDFGDIDGGPEEARLQHPLDVEYVEGTLFVADTYNNKIKAIGLHTRNVKTFCGDGAAGLADGPAEQASFDEPGRRPLHPPAESSSSPTPTTPGPKPPPRRAPNPTSAATPSAWPKRSRGRRNKSTTCTPAPGPPSCASRSACRREPSSTRRRPRSCHCAGTASSA